jgi:hypothetical protein
LLATWRQAPVAGFQISATWTARLGSSKLVPRVPLVTSTSPVGSIVALRWRRGYAIEPVHFQAGAASLRSMVSAVAVVQPPPA